ncbi:hypothetical protein AB0O75_14320 [Streptomyces sp. NPDC088921]|uniref:hypothetical protein n=1 Tax=unclassified Streptomyces TaxID=2593676 RepID=UPI003426E28C
MSGISVTGLGNMAGALAERALSGGNAVEMARALENVGLMELGLITHSFKHTDFSFGITVIG